jgi:hypothetical protein
MNIKIPIPASNKSKQIERRRADHVTKVSCELSHTSRDEGERRRKTGPIPRMRIAGSVLGAGTGQTE